MYFKETGEYIRYQKELSNLVSSEDKIIVDTFMELKKGEIIDLDKMSEILFNWCRKRI